ncbi:MAG TPA: hypothetical protein VFB42_08065 [Gaiellaceae bacterium]|nr:hypothetical protein [Gaiellaceae bacterium]
MRAPAERPTLRHVQGLVGLLEAELAIVGSAYLMAGVPVGGIVLAGRVSPLYRLPRADLWRWWSRCGCLVAAALILRSAAA